MHSDKYREVLSSLRWRALRTRLLEERGDQCERCGAIAPLGLHHKTYDRLGEELDEDVELLCETCHDQADQVRAQQTEQRVYSRRLDGWASKVYGDNWFEFMDESEAADAFEEWLEGRDD